MYLCPLDMYIYIPMTPTITDYLHLFCGIPKLQSSTSRTPILLISHDDHIGSGISVYGPKVLSGKTSLPIAKVEG